nr:enoyl-CoA hydratase/isomerase family protein [Cupriavidus pinatubonensis]
MNALDGLTLQALNDAVRDCAAAGDAVKVLVIRGSGRAFCAGNDLKWLASGVLADRAAHMRHQDLMQDTYERLESAPQIVLASINVFALAGGFELALACDLMIADEEEGFGAHGIRQGQAPD